VFGYLPTIESLSPAKGAIAGGTSVTVTGTGFVVGEAKVDKFKFGKTKAKSVNCASATSCTVLAPAHGAETVDVTVQVAKETSPTCAGDHFAYE
jgi:hypothetical protein